MDFNALEKMWGQQAVTGATAPAAELIAAMKREVRDTQQRIRRGILLVACVLGIGWTLGLVADLNGIKRVTPVDVIAEGVGFVLYVAFFVRAARSARAVRAAEAALGGTLRESVSATLSTVDVQIANAHIAAVAIPAVVAISAALLAVKYFAGYVPGVAVIVTSIFMAVLGAAIGAAFWHRYHTQLLPRRTELQATLRALDEESRT